MFLLLVFIIALSAAQDVEESMTPAEMVAHWGYPVKEYDVITDDGYILSMIRIPRGRASKAENSTCLRPPILMVHGLMVDATEYVMNPPESSPGMILADAGFDVFLLSVRGTFYSQRHINLTKADGQYWKFTLDEMANYDLPATIDMVLQLNGATSLYYVGHSQGTLISFMLLSDKPEYNKKVRAMFELGPVGTAHWLRGVVRSLLWLDVTFEGVVRMYTTYLGAHEFGLHLPWLLTGVARLFCPLANAELCRDAVFLAAGPPAKSFNWSRTPVYMANYFASTSTWNMLHFGQNAVRNEVAHFDVSPEENMRRYGKGTWEFPEYNHADYVLAMDVKERIFDKIIGIMHEWQSNSQDTDLLRRTWTDDFEVLYSIGSKIYISVFSGKSGAAAMALFPSFARYEAEGLNYAEQSEFRIQALRLVQAIAKTLDEVEDEQALERYLYLLGHRHIQYLPARIDKATWDIFKEAIQAGLNDRVNSLSQFTGAERFRAVTLWRDIIEYMLEYVKEGFYDGVKGINRFES